jgi:25S rRNA (cytosine2278-C5)-methyltransferase
MWATSHPNNRTLIAQLTLCPQDKSALTEVIAAANLLKTEKKITSHNLALVLVHDLLLSGGIQAGDGPVKQALLRHKTRLRSELQRVKIRRGVKSDSELAAAGDIQAGARVSHRPSYP